MINVHFDTFKYHPKNTLTMKYHFAKLMNYEVWANEQVIQALQSLDRPYTLTQNYYHIFWLLI
jgi:hypothetical protein